MQESSPGPPAELDTHPARPMDTLVDLYYRRRDFPQAPRPALPNPPRISQCPMISVTVLKSPAEYAGWSQGVHVFLA